MEYVFFGSTEGLESDQVNAEFGPDAILENLPMAIVLVDPAGRVAYANAMLAEILGRQCADAVGRPLADLLDAGQSRVLLAGEPSARVIEARGADGAVLTLAATCQPFDPGDGGGFRLLTFRVASPGEIPPIGAAADSVEATIGWQWEEDADGRIISLSAAAGEVLGFANSSLVGTSNRDAFDRKRMSKTDIAAYDRRITNRQPISGFEFTRSDAHGKPRQIRIDAEPKFDRAGNFTGYVGRANDLSKDRQAGSAAEGALGRKIGDLAHDLNNMLAGILANLDQAVAELHADHPARGFVEDALAAASAGEADIGNLTAQPRRRTPPATAERRARAGRRRPAPAGAQGETVLLIEDHPDFRNTSARMLRTLGYAVIVAEDGDAAMAPLSGPEKIDLLFTDIMLPGSMNGFDIARKARALRPDIKVLYASGYPGDIARQGADVGESFEMLKKPYLRHDLAARLRKVLDQLED